MSLLRRSSFRIVIIVLVTLAMVLLFYFAPLPFNGVDWLGYHRTAQALSRGEPFYGIPFGTNHIYYNPPWLIVSLLPIGLLPFRLGYAVFCVVNLWLILLVIMRVKLSAGQIIFLLMSPPVIYVLIYGQLDIFVVGVCMLLPPEWRLFYGLAKPHAALGLALGALRTSWKRAIIIALSGFLVSLVLFGNWPLIVLQSPKPFLAGAHNFWRGFWPGQLLFGALLVALAWDRRDERFFLAASPFLSPYAGTYSFVGPALGLAMSLKTWQLVLILIVWWFVTFYRWFVLGHS